MLTSKSFLGVSVPRCAVSFGALSLSVMVLVGIGLHAQEPAYDVIIRNGRIVDGTGNPWYSGDVAIRDGRIATIGRLGSAQATRVIDATGMVVSPGFIDLHTHSDSAVLADGNAESKIRQGVTVDVLGESSSVAPRDGLNEGDAQPWTTFTGYFEALKKTGTSINIVSHVAAEQVRRVVMGYASRPATPEELTRMKQLVARSMEEGAWGLVTRFESGGPAHPEEILELAKVAASHGGNYTTHIGSEGFEQESELAFAVSVAREAKIPVHVFHLKIRGRELWETMPRWLRIVDEARASGLDITANVYPYTAMQHGWSAFFPVWARDGGPEAFARRLVDPAERKKIKQDREFITWAKEHGWWEGIVMSRASRPEHKIYEGKSIAAIAKLRGDADPADTCLELMAAEQGRISGIFHTMPEENVRLVLRQPWVAIASDGSALNLTAEGVPHPRSYGTNPRVLGYYVREGVLTLEEAVRKMTSLPAQILGISDRGVLREGAVADVVVFDPARVRDVATFEAPKAYPEGIPYVLVNGVVVIDQGRHTGARPGRALRGKGYRGATTGFSQEGPAAPASATTPVPPKLAEYKSKAAADIDAMYDFTQQMIDSVFSFGELGFQEFETQRYLTGILEKEGFTIERGVAGIPTAWTARFGSGKPVIALGSDVDCIPQASQMPGVAYHLPMLEGAPGHGEGHNSGVPLNITAAIAVKRIMQREKLSGTLMLWPGIAEELLGTKAYYVREGVFKDVDIVLYNHVGSNLGTGWGESGGNGLISVEYNFEGESAHSAGAPWRGRSAMDAVELMNVGWNYRREHLRTQQRSHYVVTNGGDQPNVVPRNASVWYYFRETSYEGIKRMWEIGDDIANGAAMMTDTTLSSRVLGSAWPSHMNRTLAETMHANVVAVGLPKWTEADVTLAKALQRELKVGETGLATEIRELRGREDIPDDEKRGGGSDDIGDISWNVPTVSLSFPANIQAGPGHNWANAIAMATPIAHKGVTAGAKVQAMTVLDILMRPEITEKAGDYFKNVQTKSRKYTPLIRPEDKPAIWLNQETMAKYRPAMKKYYYDPSKYKTYLEQLGVKYPTIKQTPSTQ